MASPLISNDDIPKPDPSAPEPHARNIAGLRAIRSCKVEGMLDLDLFVKALRSKGHTVDHVHGIPENAGEYEFTIDGNLLTLEEARSLLEADEPK